MKEMLGSYADGQIEFYKAVRSFLVFPHVCGHPLTTSSFLVGHGGVGEDHTYYSAHTSRRLILRTWFELRSLYTNFLHTVIELSCAWLTCMTETTHETS